MSEAVKVTGKWDRSLGPLLSSEDVAALVGVPLAEVLDCLKAQRQTAVTHEVQLPAAWVESGRTRAEIYRQATGRDDMQGAIAFWRRLAEAAVTP